MKAFIAFPLLVALFGIILPLSFAQQNQITQKPYPEIETLKSRISELESKLQTVENVEKMELAAKLAESEARLINTEFGKLKLELKESNQQWLWNWTAFLGVMFAVFGLVLWFFVKSMIADRVEKSLNGFKEAVEQVNILQDQIRILEKEHAASVLEHFLHYHPDHEPYYHEQTALLSEKALLQVLADKTRYLELRHQAAKILADRKSTRLVSNLLELLNSADDLDISYGTEYCARDLVNFVGQIHTQESYQGLKQFLNRLLTENPEHKDVFLSSTVFSLAQVSDKLNQRDSVSILIKAIPHLKITQQNRTSVIDLARLFIRFDSPEAIKEILRPGIRSKMPEIVPECLELLQKYDPDFVEKWEAQKANANTESDDN